MDPDEEYIDIIIINDRPKEYPDDDLYDEVVPLPATPGTED